MKGLMIAAAFLSISSAAQSAPDQCWWFGNDVQHAFRTLRDISPYFRTMEEAVAKTKMLVGPSHAYQVDMITSVPPNVSPWTVQWEAQNLCQMDPNIIQHH